MRSVLAPAAVTLLLLACPGPTPTEDAGTDAGAQVSIVELCERLSNARCGLKSRCYPAFQRLSSEDCRTIENSRCLAEYDAIHASFDDELVEIVPDRLATCEERMATSACPPSFPFDYPVAVARPFSDCGLQTGLLVGKVPSGETCARAVECSPGTVCVKPGGVCRGTCSTSPLEGEPCAFGCATGLICGADGGCTQPLALDDLCTASFECAPELICESGRCRPRRRLNESCAFDPDRLSQCEPGLACDVVPFVSAEVGTCVRPQAEFGACRFHWSCQSGLVCADIDFTPFPGAAPPGGFCRTPDGEGANCAPTTYAQYVGEQCASGFSCQATSRQCTLLPKLGDPCQPSAQDCAGFDVYCKPTGSGDVGTCTGPASLGERCAFAIDAQRTVRIPCSTGYCDKTTELCRPASKPINALCEEDGECLSNRCAVQQDRTLRCAQAC